MDAELQTHDTDEAAQPGQIRSMVTRTVRKLRMLSLDRGDGAYLGSEKDLLEELGVSRPTLRQAAKVAEHEQLLEVRRGVNGGYYARRPDANDVVQGPALYLRLQAASLHDMHAVSRTLMPEAAAAAARCGEAKLTAELRALRATMAAESDDSAAGLIRSEKRLADLIGQMSRNPVFALFIDIAYAFGELEQSIRLYEDPEDRRRHRAMQVLACDAILDGDPQAARRVAEQRAEQMTSLLETKDPPSAQRAPGGGEGR